MAQIKTKFIEDSAVTTAKIANNAVTAGKITSSALGSGLTGGSGTAIAVDSSVVRTNGANAFSADQSLGGNKLTNLADPTSAQDAATKAYVDGVSAGLDPKKSVRAATTSALAACTYNNGSSGVGATLTANANGALAAQDGITLIATNRFLVKDQASALQNGIYTVTQVGDGSNPFILTRATDQDGSPASEVSGGNFTMIEQGTTLSGQGWVVVWDGNITVGTDAVNWTPFSTTTTITGGDMISVSGSTVSVDLATTSGLVSTNPGNVAGQLKVKLEASNPSLQIDGSNQLGTKLDAAGTITSGASGLKVGVDGSTIEINTNALRVKDAGVTLAKLASNSVDENKIVSTTISTTGALNGGGGTKLSARVDSSTVKINGSNNLESLKENEESITLSGTDITNQYIDLAHAVYGSSASVNSISLFVVGGPMQQKTVDYTVSLTGGSGGVTRVTFAGDLATGGNAALIASDIVVIKYNYLT